MWAIQVDLLQRIWYLSWVNCNAFETLVLVLKLLLWWNWLTGVFCLLLRNCVWFWITSPIYCLETMGLILCLLECFPLCPKTSQFQHTSALFLQVFVWVCLQAPLIRVSMIWPLWSYEFFRLFNVFRTLSFVDCSDRFHFVYILCHFNILVPAPMLQLL